MSEASVVTPSEELLPGSYDKLVRIEHLQHGKHNPRRVRPKSELIESIRRDGIHQPLVVHPTADGDSYHVTDGWQRYQAATQLGWEQLPVNIYTDAIGALEAAETASIVREWSTYEWAKYCQSVATEIEAASHAERARSVAAHVTKSWRSVDRYLAVLALPDEIHPLLRDGPTGSEQAWNALRNYNSRVREYGPLAWNVAEPLGRAYREEKISAQRAIGLAAKAVAYDHEIAIELIDLGVESPEEPLSTVEQLARQYLEGKKELWVPRTTVPLSDTKREALMEYCSTQRQPLPALVSELLDDFAEEVVAED